MSKCCEGLKKNHDFDDIHVVHELLLLVKEAGFV